MMFMAQSVPYHDFQAPNVPYHDVQAPSVPYHDVQTPNEPYHDAQAPNVPYRNVQAPNVPYHDVNGSSAASKSFHTLGLSGRAALGHAPGGLARARSVVAFLFFVHQTWLCGDGLAVRRRPPVVVGHQAAWPRGDGLAVRIRLCGDGLAVRSRPGCEETAWL